MVEIEIIYYLYLYGNYPNGLGREANSKTFSALID